MPIVKGQNIICISTIDWDFMWQGHQEIMSTFATSGNKVLFIENTGIRSPGARDMSRIINRVKNWFKGVKGIRKETDNLYILSPLVLPFPYSALARWINKYLVLSVVNRWMKAMDFDYPVIWTFLPTGFALDLINNIDSRLVVYYCIADFSKLVKNPSKINRAEEKVIKRADLIFAQGEEIKKHCEKYNKNVSIFPFGVNIKAFMKDKGRDLNESPSDIRDIKGKIIGYIGGVHKHVDLRLVRSLAEQMPEWTFLFVGAVQIDVANLKELKNVVFLGKKSHKELAIYVDSFDVCIIPYVLSEYTETVFPTKLNEYHAMGKPVVSVALPEVMRFNKEYEGIVYIGKDNDDFKVCILKALDEKDAALKTKRIEAAKDNSWDRRIEKMSELIEKAIEKKKIDREALWKETLINFYRMAKRRALRFILVFLALYLLIFKTPFIWMIAAPLKVSEQPQKAQAIVVFGGGVGETGSPGKSTIERARYAAELYRKGFAEKIVFSSGYIYSYNDAENMKLIALSMGVPEKNIILENKANSTYENVIFCKKIIDDNKWDSILLISSPYNMLRAKLVFDKYEKGVKVLYSPADKCQFYDKSENVRLEQWMAIMHEYMGIAYYLFKGHI